MTQTTDRPQHDHDEVREVDLAITGMTCASCSARVERMLNRLDGVAATVNLATEQADKVVDLTAKLDQFAKEAVPPADRPVPRVTYWSIRGRTRTTSTTPSPPRTP